MALLPTLQPIPEREVDFQSPAWQRWLIDLHHKLSAVSANILWADVSKTGSNLTDIATRNHDDLQNIDGGAVGDYTHLTAEKASYLDDVTSSLQAQLDGKVDLSGDTMTGLLTVPNLAVTATGKIYPTANGTTAIQITDLAGAAVINLDTTNKRVGFGGMVAPLEPVDVLMSATNKTGVRVTSSGSTKAPAFTAFVPAAYSDTVSDWILQLMVAMSGNAGSTNVVKGDAVIKLTSGGDIVIGTSATSGGTTTTRMKIQGAAGGAGSGDGWVYIGNPSASLRAIAPLTVEGDIASNGGAFSGQNSAGDPTRVVSVSTVTDEVTVGVVDLSGPAAATNLQASSEMVIKVNGSTGTWTTAGKFKTTGNLELEKSLIMNGGVVRLKGYTVATLPAGTQGDTAFVTDALAPAYLAPVAGGGAVVCKVFYTGANWVT